MTALPLPSSEPTPTVVLCIGARACAPGAGPRGRDHDLRLPAARSCRSTTCCAIPAAPHPGAARQGGAHAPTGQPRHARGGRGDRHQRPGAINLVTGLATAMMDSVPLVAITGNVRAGAAGKDAFEETDIVGIALPVTKYSTVVMDRTRCRTRWRRRSRSHEAGGRDRSCSTSEGRAQLETSVRIRSFDRLPAAGACCVRSMATVPEARMSWPR